MLKDQFDYLTPAELIILGEHLKLGIPHIQQHLNKQELAELLAAGPMDIDQKKRMGHNEVEIAGNLSLVLNGILTALFGGWLGYSAFLEFNTDSLCALGVVAGIATLLGACLGTLSIKRTKQQAKKAIHTQKLHLLQIEILKKIEQKRNEEHQQLMTDLNQDLIDMSEETSFNKRFSFSGLEEKSKEELSQWALQVEKMLQEKLESRKTTLDYKTYTGQLKVLQEEFTKNLINCFEKRGELGEAHSEFQAQKERKLTNLIKKLINTSPQHTNKIPSWLQSNLRSLLVGLIPTVLGGFSSISVYLGGIPKVLKNCGAHEWVAFFTDLHVKKIEVMISALITLYFGFSFIYASRKDFKRYQELQKTEKEIVQYETTLTLMDAQLAKLKELKRSIAQFAIILLPTRLSKHFS